MWAASSGRIGDGWFSVGGRNCLGTSRLRHSVACVGSRHSMAGGVVPVLTTGQQRGGGSPHFSGTDLGDRVFIGGDKLT